MSNPVGAALPPDLLALLDGRRAEEQRTKIVVVTTVDEEGFPHASLLSFGELIALDERTIRLALFAAARTLRNIVSRGAVTLAVIDAGVAYYVRGRGRDLGREVPPGPTQPLAARIVEVEINQVFRDGEVGAWITTGAHYDRCIPPAEELAEWRRVWDALLGVP